MGVGTRDAEVNAPVCVNEYIYMGEGYKKVWLKKKTVCMMYASGLGT